MKWLETPPDDWDSAPEDPPASIEQTPLQAEMLINGLVVRDPESSGAYLYADGGAVELDDWH